MAHSRDVTAAAPRLTEDRRSVPDTFTSAGNGDRKSRNDFSPETQQAYRIFQSFLLEKHKALVAPFWLPVGDRTQSGMSLKKIDGKFGERGYESITEFVADFRLMLENCYRFHGVDHWTSKQAQKLELMLEQKLNLLSRTLREKTTLAVTSRGRFHTEDEKSEAGTSNRRRSVPRNLVPVTARGSETVMVQALRLEDQQRAKEEKRQRELDKKEAEGVSAKELEDWESSLLSLAEPWSISSTWELPAIGHFLCLAQTALNLPEIVFFELERCLLMPRCSSFLAKVMTSLLCQPQRRMTLHRRPPLPYRRWEAELRLRVSGWYQSVGRAKDQEAHAEQLGLGHRFFWTLGDTSPLEKKPFHSLPFNQRVWLLKGLCDNVYETQKDVQDAVLGQPIHECRESILGYDSQENAYIHFPHFCGADLRIYRQSPCAPLEFPLPPFCVRRLAAQIAQGHPDGHLEDDGDDADLCVGGNKDHSFKEEHLEGKELDPGATDEFWFPFMYDFSNPTGTSEEHKDPQEQNLSNNYDSDRERSTSAGMNCSKKCFLANVPTTCALKMDSSPETGAQTRCRDDLPCDPCSKPTTAPRGNSAPRTRPRSEPEFNPTHAGTPGTDTGTECSPNNKRKKKRDRTFRLKRFRRNRVIKNTRRTSHDNLKRAKYKKAKIGKKDVSCKTNDEPVRLPVEPTFKVVCTSVDELRNLIGKIEEELDELASLTKRRGRRSAKQDAVTELHLTLIRLLNELLPWEPKLLKAFQRNRARLKKESDDFKKLPEDENFIREEPVLAEVERVPCRESSASETGREEEERTLTLKELPEERGPESTGRLPIRPDLNATLNVSRPVTRSSKLSQSAVLHDFDLGSNVSPVGHDPPNLQPQSAEVQPKDQILESPASAPLQRHCKPIQALLAKSVGNKVTLSSHPQDARRPESRKVPNNVVSAEPAVNPNPQPVCVPSQLFTTSSSSPSQHPVQILYKLPDGRSVQPVTEQETGRNVPQQQLYILPSNLEPTSVQQSFSVKPVSSIPAALVSSPLPDKQSRIPVQQVTPLRDANVTVKPPAAVLKPRVPSTEHNHRLPSVSTLSTNPDTNDLKQELKTVCIRDSQSILVTTRGGNTGVVKVQTSAKSGACILPSNPVFTIPQQIPNCSVSNAASAFSNPVAQTGLTGNPGKVSRSVPSVMDNGHLITCSPQSLFKSLETLSVHQESVSNSVLPDASVRTATFQNITKPPQKRAQAISMDQDSSSFSKVFLFAPRTNIPQSESPPANSTVRFTSQAGSACSTITTITKGSVASGSSVTMATKPAIQVMSPGTSSTSSSSATSTQVHGISVSGLMARMVNETTLANVSVAGAASSGRVVFFQNANAGTNSTSKLNALGARACFDGPVTLTTLNSGLLSSSGLQNRPSLFVSKPEQAPSNLCNFISTASSNVNPGVVKSVPRFCQNLRPETLASQQASPLKIIPAPQERVVINTPVPLAPGTQLLINNTKFVVPAQGLGPGSHVLVISNLPGHPGGLPGPIQVQSQNTATMLPAPVQLPPKIGQVLTPVEVPQTSGRQIAPGVVGHPSFLHPHEKRGAVASLRAVTNSWPTVVTSTAVQSSLLSFAPKSQLITNTKTLQTSVTSTGFKTPTIPVATVPPNVGANNPATINKLLMATCQPISPAQPTPGNTRALHPPTREAPQPSAKLLLSPDGAVLNVLTSPVSPGTMRLQVVGANAKAPGLDPVDPLSILTSESPAGPNY